MKRRLYPYRKRLYGSGIILLFFLLLLIHTYTHRVIPYDEQYRAIKTEHYELKKNDDYGWYDLYDASGALLGEGISYGTPLLVENEGSDDVTLYACYRDTNAYVPIPVTDELEGAIKSAMGDTAWYVAGARDYTIEPARGCDLMVLKKNVSLLYDAHVLLADEKDRQRYRQLAETYAAYFSPDDVEEWIDIGYTFAEYELIGMAQRFDDGFVYLQNNAISYVSPAAPSEGWSLTLTYDEWLRMYHYVRESENPYPCYLYDDWIPIFDALAIEYDPSPEPDSPRYQAAIAWMEQMYPDSADAVMDADQKTEQFRNVLKEYDEDGYRMGIFGVAGMDGTGRNTEDWHVLIELPEEYRRELFDFERDRIISSRGLSWDDSGRQIIYRNCELAIDTPDRLKCGWTLGEYDRIYVSMLYSAIKASDPHWELGDAFDPSVLNNLSLSDVESQITTKDGIKLQMTLSPEIDALLKQTTYDLAAPLMY